MNINKKIDNKEPHLSNDIKTNSKPSDKPHTLDHAKNSENRIKVDTKKQEEIKNKGDVKHTSKLLNSVLGRSDEKKKPIEKKNMPWCTT